MSKAIVLLSGGQDSTTCLGWAKRKFDHIIALSLFYGQRHAAELDAAKRIAQMLMVDEHVSETVPVLKSLGGSALVDRDMVLKAEGGMVDAMAPAGLPTSFVPGRNLLFLSIAAAVAVTRGAQHIVTGVCQTDYSGYPDCREVFVKSMESTINYAMPSGNTPIFIHTPLMNLNKAETVRLAFELGPDVWSALGESITCYEGQKPGCGKCPACDLRAKGFSESGFSDPAQVLQVQAQV